MSCNVWGTWKIILSLYVLKMISGKILYRFLDTESCGYKMFCLFKDKILDNHIQQISDWMIFEVKQFSEVWIQSSFILKVEYLWWWWVRRSQREGHPTDPREITGPHMGQGHRAVGPDASKPPICRSSLRFHRRSWGVLENAWPISSSG